MKLMVTGATGFLGGAICRKLIAHGDKVRAFHRATSNTSLLDDLPVEHHIGDLNDPPTFIKALIDVDVVIHCAAQLGATTDWQRYFAVTVCGTRALLAAALDAGVKRFIHTSSVAALGVPESNPSQSKQLLISEAHTWNYDPHRWPYGYAKYLAELEVQRAVTLGLDAVIINPTSVFGPGDILRNRTSIIRLVAERGLRLSTWGGMNIVHIEDVVRGHLAAIEHGLRGERYILGGENITHESFFRIIQEAAGIHPHVLTLPVPLVGLIRIMYFLTSRLLHLDINPRILNLAGLYFYYDLDKSMHQLHLPDPLSARQAVADALFWFKEHPVQ